MQSVPSVVSNGMTDTKTERVERSSHPSCVTDVSRAGGVVAVAATPPGVETECRYLVDEALDRLNGD
jgi:hypothetical protein